jgi:hypothetical protein
MPIPRRTDAPAPLTSGATPPDSTTRGQRGPCVAYAAAVGTNPAPTWQPISALPLIATMVGEVLDAAEQNFQSLGEARALPSMLDDATLDRVERVWGDTEADHWLFVEQVARWKRLPLTLAQREVVERLEGQVIALGELLGAILALVRELRPGTIDRVMEKSDIELGLEYFLRGAGSGQD